MQVTQTEAKYLDLSIPKKILLGLLFSLMFLLPILSYAS